MSYLFKYGTGRSFCLSGLLVPLLRKRVDSVPVYGTPVTSKEFYSLRNGMVLHGEPIYEENDVERANPVGMRYYYTTNDVNHSQNCWIAINWADASTFESIIGW